MTCTATSHQHNWIYRDGMVCCICDKTAEELAGEIEPARIIDVNPADLAQWEDGQTTTLVDELAEAMRAGDDVPAIMVGPTGTTLYDGHHRVAAAMQAGVTLKAAAIPMSWRQHGISANVGVLRLFAQLTTKGSGVRIG